MAPQMPSIQSFYQPEVPPSSPRLLKRSVAHANDAGDGFTSSEVEAALHPALHEWQPRTDYAELDIGRLAPGPKSVLIVGRIVNLYDQSTPSKTPEAAKGCFKVIVQDDTGAIAVSGHLLARSVVSEIMQVKLWYIKVDYQLRLGHLVSIWTPHVSNTESDSFTLHDASLFTSIFPERDNSCHFLVQEQSDEDVLCKTPMGYRDGKQLAGLITLRNYIDDGNEIAGSKILVCVKSIGGRKKCEYNLSLYLGGDKS